MIHTEIEIHETCQHVSVSEYKDNVQSVSQQVDVLQHHMPGLCALSRQTNANTLIHILLRSNTHILWFFKKSVTIQRGSYQKQTLRCHLTHIHVPMCLHTHTCTHTYIYTLTFQ